MTEVPLPSLACTGTPENSEGNATNPRRPQAIHRAHSRGICFISRWGLSWTSSARCLRRTMGATGDRRSISNATATRDPLVAPIPPNDACCPPSLQTDHPIRTTCQTTCQQTRRCEKVISSPRGYGDPGLHVFNGGRASMESCMDGERSSSRAMGRSTWSMQVAQHHRPGQESARGSDSSKPHERAMVQSRRVGYRPPRCKVHLRDDERLALPVGVGGVVPSPRL